MSGKNPPWGVKDRVRVRLGIGLGLGSGGDFFPGGFFPRTLDYLSKKIDWFERKSLFTF